MDGIEELALRLYPVFVGSADRTPLLQPQLVSPLRDFPVRRD
jgi:hypothetical protein